MSKLVLIDGHAILHRAYHAYPALTTSKGELINAVYGFTSILLTTLNQLEPEYVAVTFDKKGPTFRHKAYKKYKAHRPKVNQELIDQIKRVKQVVKVLNIPIFEKQGFEADDLIGTITKKAKLEEIIVVTGDQDILQLVDNKTKVLIPARGKKPAQVFDRKAFLKKYNFEPRYLVDFKALAGDASDAIPGVKGVGPKTAKDLIISFGTVEQIYKSLKRQNIFTKKVVDKLLKGKKQAQLSLKLAKIETNVPIKFNLKKCQLLDYDKERVIAVFNDLEFKSLITKLPSKEEGDKDKDKKNKTKDKNKQMGLF